MAANFLIILNPLKLSIPPAGNRDQGQVGPPYCQMISTSASTFGCIHPCSTPDFAHQTARLDVFIDDFVYLASFRLTL